MAEAAFSSNTLFIATLVKLRLRALSIDTKKDLHGLGPTNWRASKNHRAGWTAVSS